MHPNQNNEATSLSDVFGTVIHAYTRSQAIEDGFLIDVTETALEAGFRLPVAITSAVWADCVEWNEQDSKRQTYQDQSGRLWDVLWMAFLAARRAKSSDRVTFQLRRVPRGGRGCVARLATLQMHIGGGDLGESVITIMQPGED